MNIENKITNYINKISEAIYFSSLAQSNINDEILNLTGMSSPKIRHFLNKLCQNLDVNGFNVHLFCELPKNENNVLNYHGGLGVFVVSKK